MSSKESRSKRSLESIELADSIPESSEKLQCLTLLYALFEKFGDSFSKGKFNDISEGKLTTFLSWSTSYNEEKALVGV